MRDDHLLKTEVEWQGDVAVLRVKERRLDAYVPLSRRVKKLLSEGATRVVADLSEVEWISERFVTTLLVTMMTVDDLGGRMVAASLQPRVLEMLGRMEIDPYPPPWVCKTVDEAVSILTAAK